MQVVEFIGYKFKLNGDEKVRYKLRRTNREDISKVQLQTKVA